MQPYMTMRPQTAAASTASIMPCPTVRHGMTTSNPAGKSSPATSIVGVCGVGIRYAWVAPYLRASSRLRSLRSVTARLRGLYRESTCVRVRPLTPWPMISTSVPGSIVASSAACRMPGRISIRLASLSGNPGGSFLTLKGRQTTYSAKPPQM